MTVMGAIFTLYLVGFIALLWKGGISGVWDFLGNACATITIIFIGIFMWRGMMLP